jgi:hypothetical protein
MSLLGRALPLRRRRPLSAAPANPPADSGRVRLEQGIQRSGVASEPTSSGGDRRAGAIGKWIQNAVASGPIGLVVGGTGGGWHVFLPCPSAILWSAATDSSG